MIKFIKAQLLHKETLFLLLLFLAVVVVGVGITLLQNNNNKNQPANNPTPQKKLLSAMPPPLTPAPGSLQKKFEPSFQVASGTAALTNCAVADSEIAVDDQEQAFLPLINNYRQQNGAGPLTMSLNLSRSAAWMTHDLVKQGATLSHTDTSGRLFTRITPDCGYTASPIVGENLTAGTITSDAQTAFYKWKTACDPNPPPNGPCTYAHNTNMLDPRWQVIGIARYYDPTSLLTWYWVTDFGAATDGTTVPTTTATASATLTPTPPATPTATLTPTPPVTGSATPTPSPTGSAQYNVVNISFSAALRGIGLTGTRTKPTLPTMRIPQNPKRSVEVDIYNSDGSQQIDAIPMSMLFNNSTGLFNGTFSLVLPVGTYSAKLKTGGYLRKSAGNFAVPTAASGNATNITLPQVTLDAGDISGDNIVDVKDYNILADCFDSLYPINDSRSRLQSSSTCISHPEKWFADIDDDGIINALDYELFFDGLSVGKGD